jgi:hypothetical protein
MFRPWNVNVFICGLTDSSQSPVENFQKDTQDAQGSLPIWLMAHDLSGTSF